MSQENVMNSKGASFDIHLSDLNFHLSRGELGFQIGLSKYNEEVGKIDQFSPYPLPKGVDPRLASPTRIAYPIPGWIIHPSSLVGGVGLLTPDQEVPEGWNPFKDPLLVNQTLQPYKEEPPKDKDDEDKKPKPKDPDLQPYDDTTKSPSEKPGFIERAVSAGKAVLEYLGFGDDKNKNKKILNETESHLIP